MALPPELLLYAENFYRRFPEEFVALGAPGLEEVFDLRPTGTWSRRVLESPTEKTVEVTIRRWQPASLGGPGAPYGQAFASPQMLPQMPPQMPPQAWGAGLPLSPLAACHSQQAAYAAHYAHAQQQQQQQQQQHQQQQQQQQQSSLQQQMRHLQRKERKLGSETQTQQADNLVDATWHWPEATKGHYDVPYWAQAQERMDMNQPRQDAAPRMARDVALLDQRYPDMACALQPMQQFGAQFDQPGGRFSFEQQGWQQPNSKGLQCRGVDEGPVGGNGTWPRRSRKPAATAQNNVPRIMASTDTMKAQLQALQSEDSAAVFITRRINRLGFSSPEQLQDYFSRFGAVKCVYASHSRAKSVHQAGAQRSSNVARWRLRAAALGFVVMESPAATERIIAEGPEHMVNGVPVRVHAYHRRLSDGSRDGSDLADPDHCDEGQAYGYSLGAGEHAEQDHAEGDGDSEHEDYHDYQEDYKTYQTYQDHAASHDQRVGVIFGRPQLPYYSAQELQNAMPDMYED
mmetsp:Transcript_97019/g.250929  ORF Transcript_97019/g.250929 Transcript_97019/m.250929 type:complete len:515 (-) Transcript_97019:410-1954(-)